MRLVMGVRRAGRFLGDETLLSGAAPRSQGSGSLQAAGDQEGSPRRGGQGHRKTCYREAGTSGRESLLALLLQVLLQDVGVPPTEPPGW